MSYKENMITLENVIKDYLEQVNKGVELLQQKYSVKDLLGAWRSGVVPKTGHLIEGIEYDFHGKGCFLIHENYILNFDFGINGRHDGFDEWRIQDYLSQRLDLYPNYSNMDKFSKEFRHLVENNIIYHPDPKDPLYYFRG